MKNTIFVRPPLEDEKKTILMAFVVLSLDIQLTRVSLSVDIIIWVQKLTNKCAGTR